MDSPGPPCRVLGWGSHQIWESLLGVTHKQRRRELNNQLCVQWRSTSRHLHGPIQYFKIKQDCPGFLAKKDPSQSQLISRDRKQLIHEHTFQMQTGSSPLLQRLPLLGSQTPACSPTCPAPMARYQMTRGSPDAPESTEIIQKSQSYTCLPCLSNPSCWNHCKGSITSSPISLPLPDPDTSSRGPHMAQQVPFSCDPGVQQIIFLRQSPPHLHT